MRVVKRLGRLALGVASAIVLSGWDSDPTQYQPVTQPFNVGVFYLRPISFDGGNTFINLVPGVKPAIQYYDGSFKSFSFPGDTLLDADYDRQEYVGLSKRDVLGGYNLRRGTITRFSGTPLGGFSRLVAIDKNTFIAGLDSAPAAGLPLLKYCVASPTAGSTCTDLTNGPKSTSAGQHVYDIKWSPSLKYTWAASDVGLHYSTNNRDFLSTGLNGPVLGFDGTAGDWIAATYGGVYRATNPGGPFSINNDGLPSNTGYTYSVFYDQKRNYLIRADNTPYPFVSGRPAGSMTWSSYGQINLRTTLFKLAPDPRGLVNWQVGSTSGLLQPNATGVSIIDPGTRGLGIWSLNLTGGSLSAGGYYSRYGFAESTNSGLSYGSDPFTDGMHVGSILKDGTRTIISGLTGMWLRQTPSGLFGTIAGPPTNSYARDMALSPDGRAILAQNTAGVSVSVSPTNWQMFVPWSAGLDTTDSYGALAVSPSSTALFGGRNSYVSPGIGYPWTPSFKLSGGATFRGTAVLPIGNTFLAGGNGMVNPPGYNFIWADAQGNVTGQAGTNIPADAIAYRLITLTISQTFQRSGPAPEAASLANTTYLFAATSRGLYVSTDNAQTWSLFSQALGTAPVLSLAADATHLWVGTQGQGLVAYKLPPRFDRLVPIVLDVDTGSAHYTTELALTNRGRTASPFSAQYTASLGSGSGVVNDTLAAGQQLVIPDVLTYLRQKGLQIPVGGAQGGTLLFTFYGATADAAPAVTARTAALTGLPLPVGRAGLAYSAIDPATGTDGSLILYGLRSNDKDRSNVAVFNTSDTPVSVRVTAYSGAGDGASTVVAASDALPAWGWKQYNGVLGAAGYANGWVKIDRVSGARTYFSAYAVINDNVTNDGSFVLPTVAPPFPAYANVPVVVETSAFGSEIVLANSGATPATFAVTYQESLSGSATGTVPVVVAPHTQMIQTNAIAWLRTLGIPIGPAGAANYAGSIHLEVTGASPTDTYAGARTSSLVPGGGEFGLFTPPNPPGEEGTTDVYIYGLRADAENRSNVAVVHIGDPEDGPITLSIQAYDGDAGGAAKGNPAVVILNPGQWMQLNGFLGQQGVANGWVHVTRTAGVANWIAYGVINDGGQPGQRTGDGAYVPMSR